MYLKGRNSPIVARMSVIDWWLATSTAGPGGIRSRPSTRTRQNGLRGRKP